MYLISHSEMFAKITVLPTKTIFANIVLIDLYIFTYFGISELV